MAARAQNHIHLQPTADGPWGSPEYVPTNTYSVLAEGYAREPSVFVSVERGLTGKLHVHRLADTQIEDIGHVLVVTHAELTTILGDLGETVDFVDNYHDDDGENSSSYVQQKVFTEVRGIKLVDPYMQYYYVRIILQDDSV